MKTCRVCKQTQPIDCFAPYPGGRTADGRRSDCRTCSNAANQRWKEKNPEKWKLTQKVAAWKWRYGITPDQYHAMLSDQKGLCRVCGLTMTKPNIDHNHETKKIRGLLCNNCNRGIGHLKDSISNLLAAIAYLKSETDGGRGE